MAEDLVVGIKLKADGSDLVGAVRVSRGELDRLGQSTGRTGRDADRLARGLDGVERETRDASRAARGLSRAQRRLALGFGESARRARLLRVALIALATGTLARVAKSFLDAASTSEQFQVRLRILLGDAGEANRLFEEMTAFAARVPFEFEEIMASATQLAGILRGGVDEISQWIPLIGDLAAASGLSIQETTGQIVRMLSAGAGAADLFRERGILAMLGFQAGVAVSAEDTRKKLLSEWQKASSQFRGATDELVQTWSGGTSMMSDKWFQFRNMVMDAAPFDFLKASVQLINEEFENNAEEMRATAQGIGVDVVEAAKTIALGAASVFQVLTPAIEAVGGALGAIWDGFTDLAAKFPLVAEFGIVGAILLGRKGIAALAIVSALDDFADDLNRITQDFLKEIGAPEGLRDFLNNPTGFAFGDNPPLGLPGAAFGRGGPAPGSFRAAQETGIVARGAVETVENVLFRIEQRMAQLARSRAAAGASASGGGRAAGLPALPSLDVRGLRSGPAAASFRAAQEEGLEEGIRAFERLGDASERERKRALDFLSDVTRAHRVATDDQIGLINLRTQEQLDALETLKLTEEEAARARVLINQTAAEEIRLANQEAFEGVGRAIEQAGDRSASALEDAVFRSRNVLGGLFEDLQRIAFRTAITEPLGGLFTSVLKSFLPGFQHGGSFVVGGTGGPDSQVVAFRGTPGERVLVIPEPPIRAAVPAAAGGGAVVNVKVINNAPVGVAAGQSRNSNDGLDLVFTIDSMVARNIRSPGSLSNLALRDTFGAQQVLAVR